MSSHQEISPFLTYGHVWVHRKSNKEARVLAVTNLHLTEELQAKYPPMVVYADSNDYITSTPVDVFTRSREFLNVDPDLESNLFQMVAIINGEPVEASASESDTVVGQQQDLRPHGSPNIEFESSSNQAVPRVTADSLAQAFMQYEQVPGPEGQTYHKLAFDTTNLSEAEIDSAFNGEIHYAEIKIDNSLLINWDAYLGLYPLYDIDGTWYVTAVFVTDNTGAVAQAEEPAHQEQPAVEVTSVSTPEVYAAPGEVGAEPAVVLEEQASESSSDEAPLAASIENSSEV